MGLVKIAHLLAAVASAGVDFLARRLDQPSNRPVPRGTGVADPGAVPHYRSARVKEQREAARRAEQPPLFELRDDSRPPTERTATGRYREPSLFAPSQ
jgi:hypothetical protein